MKNLNFKKHLQRKELRYCKKIWVMVHLKMVGPNAGGIFSKVMALGKK